MSAYWQISDMVQCPTLPAMRGTVDIDTSQLA